MDRRTFVGRAAAALLAGGGLLHGCAAVISTRIEPTGGRLRLTLRDHPGLSGPRGFLKVRAGDDPTPLYVLALEEGGYTTLSPICTHQACTVDVEGPRLVCPCHGSMYDRRGAVLRGPAPRALRAYPTRLTDDGELLIELEAAG